MSYWRDLVSPLRLAQHLPPDTEVSPSDIRIAADERCSTVGKQKFRLIPPQPRYGMAYAP